VISRPTAGAHAPINNTTQFAIIIIIIDVATACPSPKLA
jgi:hypothetical protein